MIEKDLALSHSHWADISAHWPATLKMTAPAGRAAANHDSCKGLIALVIFSAAGTPCANAALHNGRHLLDAGLRKLNKLCSTVRSRYSSRLLDSGHTQKLPHRQFHLCCRVMPFKRRPMAFSATPTSGTAGRLDRQPLDKGAGVRFRRGVRRGVGGDSASTYIVDRRLGWCCPLPLAARIKSRVRMRAALGGVPVPRCRQCHCCNLLQGGAWSGVEQGKTSSGVSWSNVVLGWHRPHLITQPLRREAAAIPV